MKAYYKLTFSSERKQVGCFPQSQTGSLGGIQDGRINWRGKIEFNFELPEIYLEKPAKYSSILSCPYIPPLFIVGNDEFVDFLINETEGPYQSWSVIAHHKKQILSNYNLFVLNDTKEDQFVDFSKSIFYSRKLDDWGATGIVEEFTFNNYTEYFEKQESCRSNKQMILAKKMVHNFTNMNEEFFRVVGVPNGGYFVSEELKHKIEQRHFTGMSFEHVDQ
jgi:hypothetical protein